MFKFNAGAFPNSCPSAERVCLFGGAIQPYTQFSQEFAYASSSDSGLQQGGACLGDTTTDPVGATFQEVYSGKFFYVVWNDQFYGDPLETKLAPWGHSKGMLSWNEDGNGLVMQVTTPDWPASGSAVHPRQSDGNTLGCIEQDNDILVSQHFFSLKLDKNDVVAVLKALSNASVVTDPSKSEIVSNGGPSDVQALVGSLGSLSKSKQTTIEKLSSGVVLISKPANLSSRSAPTA